MTHKEKCELLKDTIYQLYTKEGRSKNYISKLLEINRPVLTEKIQKWDFPKPKNKLYIPPATEKFLKKNKEYIISKLNQDMRIIDLGKQLNVDKSKIYSLFKYDKDIKKAYEQYIERRKNKTKVPSKLNYEFEDIQGEEWKEILGYPQYYISNRGRVKKWSKKANSFYLLTLSPNLNNSRLYVMLYNKKGRQNLQVSRLVGFAFLDNSYSLEKNIINHKDGNVQNNCVENLEWVSQSENQFHAYKNVNRTAVKEKKFIFNKILYKDKYEFNTVAALARFLNKSETQVRRYLEEPDKHNLKFT